MKSGPNREVVCDVVISYRRETRVALALVNINWPVPQFVNVEQKFPAEHIYRQQSVRHQKGHGPE